VETFRYAYLGAGTVNVLQLVFSFGLMLVVIIIGAVIFNRVEATFMDTV
jgi:lipopolysaccharide transport system permease protein